MAYGARNEHDVSVNKVWVWPLVAIVGLSITAGIIGMVVMTKIKTDGLVRTTEIQTLKR